MPCTILGIMPTYPVAFGDIRVRVIGKAGCGVRQALVASLPLLLLFAVSTKAQTPPPDTSKPPLQTAGDVSKALRACFSPPQPYPGMRVTVRLSFNRSGEIWGQPHVTFVTPEAPAEVRTAYTRAMLESVTQCTPLKFSPELGAVVAGHPYYLHFIEYRTGG